MFLSSGRLGVRRMGFFYPSVTYIGITLLERKRLGKVVSLPRLGNGGSGSRSHLRRCGVLRRGRTSRRRNDLSGRSFLHRSRVGVEVVGSLSNRVSHVLRLVGHAGRLGFAGIQIRGRRRVQIFGRCLHIPNIRTKLMRMRSECNSCKVINFFYVEGHFGAARIRRFTFSYHALGVKVRR